MPWRLLQSAESPSNHCALVQGADGTVAAMVSPRYLPGHANEANANAAFIVEACNACDPLRKAVGEAIEDLEGIQRLACSDSTPVQCAARARYIVANLRAVLAAHGGTP